MQNFFQKQSLQPSSGEITRPGGAWQSLPTRAAVLAAELRGEYVWNGFGFFIMVSRIQRKIGMVFFTVIKGRSVEHMCPFVGYTVVSSQ
jgi:hypothetical protein